MANVDLSSYDTPVSTTTDPDRSVQIFHTFDDAAVLTGLNDTWRIRKLPTLGFRLVGGYMIVGELDDSGGTPALDIMPQISDGTTHTDLLAAASDAGQSSGNTLVEFNDPDALLKAFTGAGFHLRMLVSTAAASATTSSRVFRVALNYVCLGRG